MAGDGRVNWYAEDVILQLGEAVEAAVAEVAAVVDAQTKVNIIENDQVDTGFMVNSVYHASRQDSTYSEANQTGTYLNQRNDTVRRELSPEADLPSTAIALVCVGASYAIYQEMQNSFLYRALLDVAGKSGGTLERTAKSRGLHA